MKQQISAACTGNCSNADSSDLMRSMTDGSRHKMELNSGKLADSFERAGYNRDFG